MEPNQPHHPQVGGPQSDGPQSDGPQSDQPSLHPSRLRNLVRTSILLIATCVAYIPALQCGFIWDDDDYVVKNQTLRDLAGLKSIWFDLAATPQYYPLVHSSFWFEYQCWGLNPIGYHVTNILIHAINAILIWQILLRLAVPAAWLAALVFAIHPVHVESVAWITERKNVLSGMFYLFAVISFLRFWNFTEPVDAKTIESHALNSQRWFWFVVAHLCFIAALLSKTVTATLPAVLLVLVWWKQGQIPIKKSLCLLPMLIIGIAFGLVTVWLEKYHVGATGMDWELSFLERCLIAGRALWFYAAKLVWPTNLIFTYPRWEIDTEQWWQLLYPLAAIALMIALWMKRASIGRGPLAAVLIFSGTLFPALGFLDVYPMRFSYVADHFQYLASIAIISLGIATASIGANKIFIESPHLMKLGAVVLVVGLMILTALQTRIYEGLEPLWRDTLAKNPTSFLAHNNLGAILTRRGEFAEAEQHIREAMEIKPDFVDSVVNMGKIKEGQGDIDSAYKYYLQATQMNSTYAPALNGLGAMYGAKGDLRAAEAKFKEAVRCDPRYASARMNLATIYLSRQENEAAIEQLESVIKDQPDLRAAQDSLVQAYATIGKFDAASELLATMLSQNPDDVNLLGASGIMLANQKKYSQAISYFERILKLKPNLPEALYTLAEMHRELGEIAKAEEFMKAYEQQQTLLP